MVSNFITQNKHVLLDITYACIHSMQAYSITNSPDDVDCLGAIIIVDNLVFMVDDVDAVIDELDSVSARLLDETDIAVDEDDTTVGNLLVAVFSNFVDVTLGVGIVALVREMLLNVIAGTIPLTALPRGVIKSRLTAVAVNEYGSERSIFSKDPSTVSLLSTTGIVLLIDWPLGCLVSDTIQPPTILLHDVESVQ